MITASEIEEVYSELISRCDYYSAYTVNDLLRGKRKVKSHNASFAGSAETMPTLDDVKNTFRKCNCAIFTAFRGEFTIEENIERNACLKADMTDRGMKFSSVIGRYREAARKYPSVENCFFVYDKNIRASQDFFCKVYELSAKYAQDCFLYKRAGINRMAFLVATSDAGRRDLSGDVLLAGQIYENVPEGKSCTDCSNGRFAFQFTDSLTRTKV